ncbi:MerR family transcriptional regulator [Loigolactobacillus binensis]|uniref:MerR family transcriptional regulator n=1 Tax=Loigolactobacillus binensis TaxID=2559922 RepID=A0ABW3EBF9_9LACO|nr:MerR family transcriptional regulator [Loigolactobacillus binensis]
MYSIRDVSQIMDISIYTLRYYEKIGLLSFVQRNENGIREFSKADIVTLNTVYRLKQTDMSLKDIKHYLELVAAGMASVPERKAMFQAQKDKVQHKIAALQNALQTIDGKLHYYEEADKQGSLAVCHDEREAFMQKILNGAANN